MPGCGSDGVQLGDAIQLSSCDYNEPGRANVLVSITLALVYRQCSMMVPVSCTRTTAVFQVVLFTLVIIGPPAGPLNSSVLKS